MGVIPEKSSHCSPLQPTITWQFQSWGVIPEKSSHCSPLLHGNVSHGGVIPEKSSHCSPLQPTLTWQFQSWGVIPEKSSHCSPLQPIAAHSYMAILIMGGNSSKVLPLHPNSYIILPPLNKLPPHSYINLPPIDKLPPPPPLLHQNGRILGRTFDPGGANIPKGSLDFSVPQSSLSDERCSLLMTLPSLLPPMCTTHIGIDSSELKQGEPQNIPTSQTDCNVSH